MPNRLQEARIAQNEHFFRSVNQDLADAAQRFEAESKMDYMCECASSECTEHVALTLDEYTALRDNPRRFVIVPGHEASAVEIVVQVEEPRFAVVEKIGHAGQVATQLYAAE